MNPERVGDYELVEYLAAGGMADLYLARGPRQPGPVVLKTIQRKYVEHTRVVKMFVDEGRIAKALDHSNIVRIHDVGADRGAYFIVMEFIPGRDLLAIARRGIEAGRFLPLHIAIAIIAQVATGLTYAHEKVDEDGLSLRVVHCDISPGNVVVSFGGTAKIVDFGIARAAIQLRAEDHTVVGKYNYMAPEQIRGQSLDARADLFSLGVILYELTVGRRLFRGAAEDVKSRILSGDIIRPREINPDLPEALERVILRCLEIDPKRRYARARDLRADLLDVLASDGRPAGKREIAEYMRDIFVPPPRPLYEAVEGDEAFARDVGETDEELALDLPVPGLSEIVVDADDPEPPPPPDSEEADEHAHEPEDETIVDTAVDPGGAVAPMAARDSAPTIVDVVVTPRPASVEVSLEGAEVLAAAPSEVSSPTQLTPLPPDASGEITGPTVRYEPAEVAAPPFEAAASTEVDTHRMRKIKPAEVAAAASSPNATGKVAARISHPQATRGEFLVAFFAVVIAALAYLFLAH